jgi:hypothetical protein
VTRAQVQGLSPKGASNAGRPSIWFTPDRRAALLFDPIAVAEARVSTGRDPRLYLDEIYLT